MWKDLPQAGRPDPAQEVLHMGELMPVARVYSRARYQGGYSVGGFKVQGSRCVCVCVFVCVCECVCVCVCVCLCVCV